MCVHVSASCFIFCLKGRFAPSSPIAFERMGILILHFWERKSIPVMRWGHPSSPHPGRMMYRKKSSLGLSLVLSAQAIAPGLG